MLEGNGSSVHPYHVNHIQCLGPLSEVCQLQKSTSPSSKSLENDVEQT